MFRFHSLLAGAAAALTLAVTGLAATPAISTARLPLVFERNQGQAPDPQAQYLSHAGSTTLLLGTNGVRFSEPGHQTIEMNWEGGNPDAALSADQPQASYSNYYLGNDPQRWHTHVPHFGAVRYRSVYPGIDLVFHGNQKQLEYDFVLAPQADPSRIALRFCGADAVTLDPDGSLVLKTKQGELRQHVPVLYQESKDGRRTLVAGHYVRRSNGLIGFETARYDRRQPLVIDPILSYATYFGGSGNESGYALAVDASGNMYLGGTSASNNLPVTASAAQKTVGDTYQGDGFLAKLNASGTSLVYCTYVGGNNSDSVRSLAIDGSGNLYATGLTGSSNFPTTSGAYKTSIVLNGNSDSFVLKLNATGQFVYSTYVAGTGANTSAQAIAVDASGKAYVTGSTNTLYSATTIFPTTANAFQSNSKGNSDAFVLALNATGTAAVYSTLIGGSGADGGQGIVVDGSGNATITGYTSPASSNSNIYNVDFPVTAGAYKTTSSSSNSYNDAFVTQLNPSGSALNFSTLLGGSVDDIGEAIAVDTAGNFYITGGTSSSDFPTTAGAYQQTAGSGFITKLNATGSTLIYSTYFNSGSVYSSYCNGLYSSRGCEGGSTIAVDAQGAAYVVGTTSRTTSFPVTPGALQTVVATSNYYTSFAYFLQLNPAGSFVNYATFFGGTYGQTGEAVALDSAGNVYLAGTTGSPNMPVTSNAFQSLLNGVAASSSSSYGYDAYIAKISMQAGTCSVSSMPLTVALPATATSGSIAVTAPAGCPWTASYGTYYSNSSLPLTFSSPLAGVGSSTIQYSAPLNYTNSARTGALQVSGQTVSFNQAALPCTYTLQPTSLDVPASGGVGNVKLLTPTGCTWSVASNSSWITVTSVTSGSNSGSSITTTGSGDGGVQYSVQPNTTSLPRSGTISIGDQSFTITQTSPNCTFTLAASAGSVPGAGGTGSVALTTTSGCSWTASSNASWLSVSTPSGTGNSTVGFTAAANLTGAARTGTLVIGGNTYTVTQPDGSASCSYAVTPTAFTMTAAASSTMISITAPAGCSWTYSSNASWLTLTNTGGTSSGNGSLTVNATQNTALARTGTVTIAGQTVTITQSAPAGFTTLVTDVGIFRPTGSGGVLWVRDRNGDGVFTGGTDTAVTTGSIGTAGDIPLLGDWNGSGTKKLGVYRPASSSVAGQGLFVLDYNGDEQYTTGTDKAYWFSPAVGDVPVVGRWNGGTKDQIGIFRSGVWYLDVNGDGTFAKTVILGQSGDVPVVGDWNGTGTTKVGVFRNGLWILDYNGNGQWDGPSIDKFFYLGQAGDTPIVGDWNGSGTTKAGIYRNGLWVLDYNGNFQWDGTGTDKALFNGVAGDLPVLGDWTGDGKLKAGVFHQGTFFLDVMGDGSFSRLAFIGQAGDTPIAGKF